MVSMSITTICGTVKHEVGLVKKSGAPIKQIGEIFQNFVNCRIKGSDQMGKTDCRLSDDMVIDMTVNGDLCDVTYDDGSGYTALSKKVTSTREQNFEPELCEVRVKFSVKCHAWED